MNNPATTPASVPAATAAASLFGRYATQLTGQLRCFDRVLLHGPLVDVAHPGACAGAVDAAAAPVDCESTGAAPGAVAGASARPRRIPRARLSPGLGGPPAKTD